MRNTFFLIVILALGLSFASTAYAQSPVQVVELPVEYTFADHILFKVQIIAEIPIASVTVLFHTQENEEAYTGQAEVGPDGVASYRFDSAQNLLRPFTTISYTFHISLQDGQQVATEERSFRYIDNRFQWQGMEDAAFHVYWYAGDVDFGQNAFDVAHLAMQQIKTLLDVPPIGPVDVYIYASAQDLQSALGPGTQNWAAGHASPESGVVMVSVSPTQEQSIDMERQIPHELSHIVLFRATGEAYARLPVWLNEGIASLVELYPNPDYERALRLAVQNRTLIPLADLCSAVPPDASRAFLAYAESESFTRFLHDKFGISGFLKLFQAYAEGLGCDQGVSRALGRPLSDLEHEWRRSTLGENQYLAALEDAAPYLVLLVLVLIVPIWSIATASSGRKANAEKPK
jgi:hypothetical protein